MTISFDKAIGPHAAALALRSQRFSVLANNIANADTPKYQARDVDFRSTLRTRLDASAGQQAMRTTSSRHFTLPGVPAGLTDPRQELAYRVPVLPSEDGNTVDVQIEQAQIAANNLQTQAAMTFLSKRFEGLMTAVRGE